MPPPESLPQVVCCHFDIHLLYTPLSSPMHNLGTKQSMIDRREAELQAFQENISNEERERNETVGLSLSSSLLSSF